MARLRLRFALFTAMLAPNLVLAQPAPAPPSRQAIESFVDAFVTPTQKTGKIPRWETGICAVMAGQKPDVSAFVTQHLTAIATAVGAPVSTNKDCKANIDIVFTTAPQALLDNIRQQDADYLGYAPSNEDLRKLALVTHPIQAWYSTGTRDLAGRTTIDSGRDRGDRGPASTARVTGNLVSDGVRSTFHHILIVVDPSKLDGQEIVPLADYIAVLALSQINSLDNCQPLGSIVNMLAAGCTAKVEHITENDLAYLRGVYRMNPDRIRLASQKTDIADQMAQALGGR
jgi:hypothetical protein